MPQHTCFRFTTLPGNPPPLDVVCTCDDFWSVAQHRAMLEVYPPVPDNDPYVVELSREPPRFIPPPREPVPLGPDAHLLVPDWRAELLADARREQFRNPASSPKEYRERLVKKLTDPVVIEKYQRGGYRFAIRARLIARAYACMYLEHFEHGKPALLGRFYWAGLAAFASKQVACTLENLIVRVFAPDTVQALGKGNLWLYNDAWPWHYAWALCPASVHKCAAERDTRNLHPIVLDNLQSQEWAESVVPCVPWHIDENTGIVGESIGYLRIAPLMTKAIATWTCVEAESNPGKRQKLCMRHLWAMARHEQGEVLQGLVYADKGLLRDLERSRTARDGAELDQHFILFKLQLSFSADEYTSADEFRSDAPRGISLELYKQRMNWIKQTARKYDDLMSGSKSDRMLAELRKLAEWDG